MSRESWSTFSPPRSIVASCPVVVSTYMNLTFFFNHSASFDRSARKAVGERRA